VYRRFCGIILFFLGSIFTLVFSADLLTLFVAWDLLGFTSLFLVIFFRSRASLAGGLLTGLTNRIGDVFLLLLFGCSCYSTDSPLTTSLYFLFFVRFTKSAQVPFSSWLPAAILAPTPVSALVHSSTLVTAGVYLLYRFSPVGSVFLISIGLLTTLLAGFSAFLESDAKKIIALSTLSQLGLIVTCLGYGERALCFAHLNTHAAFKALLFLGVGTVIHSRYGSQELRSTALLTYSSPFVLVILVTACSAMCGLIFLSGWVTKEAILVSSLNVYSSLFSLLLFYLGIGLTLLYSLRLLLIFLLCMCYRPCTSCTGSVALPVKAPLFFLLRLTIRQGSLFNYNVLSLPRILSSIDILLVYGVLAFFLLITFMLIVNFGSTASPISGLCNLSFYTSRYSLLASKVVSTEVSAYHGGGLAYLPSLVSPLRISYHFHIKLCVLLIIIFVIV